MSLDLDARQRAMLQEMGVTVWASRPATPPGPAAQTAASSPVSAQVPAPAAAAPVLPRPAPSPRGAQTAQAAGIPRVAPPATAPPTPTSTLKLHAAQALYPAADPAQVPTDLGGAWLIVAESAHPEAPLSGDAGRLLDNMLRAMQLHRHPRVYLAALARSSPQAPASDDIPSRLADTVATLQPAVVLLLGHVAARMALGRTEPLGHLRVGPHTVAGCPAVVTYDPAFLLRSQDAKAAAWVDLCRALAIVRNAAPA